MTLQLPINDHDQAQGSKEAPIVLVQYGDFECPYSGAAFAAIKAVQEYFGDRLLYVFRQFPLFDIHPHALQAAEAAESAAAQGHFWPMHDHLFKHQNRLGDENLRRYAEQIGLDLKRFETEMQQHTHRAAIHSSIEGGRQSGVHGTPTFFINGRFFDNREGLWTLKCCSKQLSQHLPERIQNRET